MNSPKNKKGDFPWNHSMPGTPTQACYLRRRRREVALFCSYISRMSVPLLDAKPTLTLRLGHNILTNREKMEVFRRLIS